MTTLPARMGGFKIIESNNKFKVNMSVHKQALISVLF